MPRLRLPCLDLRGTFDAATVRGDLAAALTTTVIAVPQGVAYASIAKLPPVMGLYAASLATMVAAFTRSSRHVLPGPTNAVSLLVGGAMGVTAGADPFVVATTLAVLVGLMQVGAGVLRLGAVVDFISRPVVLGYITGAGLLIGIGQLHKITRTAGGDGDVLNRFAVWFGDLAAASPLSVAMALGTTAAIVALRRLNRRLPGPMLVIGAATALVWALDLSGRLETVRDLEPVTASLPPLTLPDWQLTAQLVPMAIAVTVLSLVESSSVGRAIAARTGQRLDSAWDFIGLGLGNVTAGLTGGYPISGSLSRSGLNEQSGAKTRMAGVYSGALMLLVLLLLGPAVNYTPTAALAGLLLVVAWDLVDRGRIAVTLRASWADRVTFLATMLGTWAMPLDKAVYLGVGLSLVFLLRQARMLTVKLQVLGPDAALHPPHEAPAGSDSGVHVLHLEGRLFFAVEGELRALIDDAAAHPALHTLVLRLRRTQGMDVTIATVLVEAAARLAEQDRRLLLTGLSLEAHALLARTNALAALGEARVFVRGQRWHAAALGGAPSTP